MIVMHRKLKTIYDDFGTFWRRLTSDSQLRWVTYNEERHNNYNMTIIEIYDLDILDRTGERCDTFSYSGYYKRIVGLVGAYRG